MPASRNLLLADMNETIQEGTGGENNASRVVGSPSLICDSDNRAVFLDQTGCSGLDDLEIALAANLPLHGIAIELSIGLSARAAHGRTLRPIQEPELDAGLIGNPSHQPVKGIDLTDEMTLAKTTNGRIAGHFADGRESMGEKCRPGAQTRGRRCGLYAGMSSTDNDDIEIVSHAPL